MFQFGRPKGDRRAADLDQRLAADLPFSPTGTRPGADPASAQGRARMAFSAGLTAVLGRVVDAVAGAHFYKVQLANGMGTARCCAGVHTSLRVTGPRQLNSYGPGDAVLVLYDPKGSFHYILCAVPDWLSDARQAGGDEVSQGSNVGLRVDDVHRYPFLTTGRGGVIDFSAGRPGDSLPGCEWGAVSEFGLRILLDAYMAQVAVDEATGLFVFYDDQLTRLAGHNLQIRSAGHEREDLDDESEVSSVQGWTPYAWEAAGCKTVAAVPAVTLDAETAQRGTPHLSRVEPVNEDQLPVFRDLEFRGYLGQGGKKMVVAPTGTGLERYSGSNTLAGLADLNAGLDGSVFNRSAHSQFFVKAPFIPAPKRKARPESRTGDRTDDAYRSCGLYGSGPYHEVAGQPANGNTHPHVVEAASVLDQLTYAFNWKGLHPFHYHALDWYLHDEDQTPAYGLVTPTVIPFADLEDNHFLPPAPHYDVKVDDRYGLVRYYANVSAFGLLPNGGVVLADGWGSELRMSAGIVEEHAAGDLVKTAGRNVHVRAGANFAVAAYDSADVSAAKGDVRLKAEKKLMLLGGNDGCGGVLVESRGEDTAFDANSGATEDVVSGIVFKSPNAAVVALVKDLAVHAGGSVLLEAGDNIATSSAQFRRHVSDCAIDFFGSTSVNEYWAGQARFGADVVVAQDAYVGGNFAAVGVGLFGPSVRATAVNLSDPLDASLLASITSDISGRDLTTVRTESAAEVTWFLDNSEVEDLGFYFRPSSATLSTDFKIVEPVWQQLARQTGQTMPVWTEPVVDGAGHGDTVPFPGYDAWVSGTGYGRQDSVFFDPYDSAAVDRGSVYETPVLATTSWVAFQGNWPVIQLPV